MNEQHLHDLIDEALQIQHQGGDLEAFYKLHEDYRSEIASLLSSSTIVRSLAPTRAPQALRSQASRITAHDQEQLLTWHTYFAPQLLFRVAALAVFVVLLGGGFAFQQNTTRKETLASFDAAAIDHQNFLNTVGEPAIVASLPAATESTSVMSTFAAPKTTLAPESAPVVEESLTPPSTGFGALYDAQTALDALQNDITTLP